MNFLQPQRGRAPPPLSVWSMCDACVSGSFSPCMFHEDDDMMIQQLPFHRIISTSVKTFPAVRRNPLMSPRMWMVVWPHEAAVCTFFYVYHFHCQSVKINNWPWQRFLVPLRVYGLKLLANVCTPTYFTVFFLILQHFCIHRKRFSNFLIGQSQSLFFTASSEQQKHMNTFKLRPSWWVLYRLLDLHMLVDWFGTIEHLMDLSRYTSQKRVCIVLQ